MMIINQGKWGKKMKKWIILILLFLSACNHFEVDEPDNEVAIEPVDAYDEVAPHFDEIEALLTQVELEVGLDNLTAASSVFNELMEIVNDHEVTQHQQARINTMAELLTDMLAYDNDGYIFSGSDAAAKVMNLVGAAPTGYTFVYHDVPSSVGSDGLGYYVFLVPVDHERSDEMEIRETFFVTDRGEILTFD